MILLLNQYSTWPLHHACVFITTKTRLLRVNTGFYWKKIPNSLTQKYFKNNLLESLNALAVDSASSNLLILKFTTAVQRS